MPEGDTIHRAAAAMAKALVGKKILAARSTKVRAQLLVGRTVVAVEAIGKHLVIRFDRPPILQTHMRMTGSWHLYRPGSRWQRPEHRARIVLETADAIAVCFDAPTVRLVDRPDVDALGPDVVSESFDERAAIRRLRALGDLEIGAAILDQRAIAGVGNIWKSESLFRVQIDPFACVRDLSDDDLARLVDAARRLMSARLDPSARPIDGHAVYRRRGKPCPRCGDAIATRRQGSPPRNTYYCPTCQRPRSAEERRQDLR